MGARSKAILEFKEKFGKELSETDALKYAGLKKELGYWLTLEKRCEEEDCITEDIAKETKELFKKNYGQDITIEQASLEAKKSLILTIADVRTRIDNEFREIISNNLVFCTFLLNFDIIYISVLS